MKTYTLTKPLPGLTLGATVTAEDLEPFGGVERMLEFQKIAEISRETPVEAERPDVSAVLDASPIRARKTNPLS